MPAARKLKASSNATTSTPVPSAQPTPSRSSAPRRRQDSTATIPDMSDQQDQPPDAAWTEPPWIGFLETTEDALLILEAARRRLIPRVTRRLADRERRLIQSGSVFVFEEEESGIKRWTDGFLWSPSRILGNFLLYRETDKRNPDGTPATRPGRSSHPSNGHSLLVTEEPSSSAIQPNDANASRWSTGSLSRPKTGEDGYSAPGSNGLDRARERILLGSLTNSQKFKEDGMMKKASSGKTHHLVSYYKVSDVEAGRLRTPSSLPEFAALEISPEFLDKTHFRVQPRVELGEDGRVRFRGETVDEPDSPAPETPPDLPSTAPVHLNNPPPSTPSAASSSTQANPSSHGHSFHSHPYHRSSVSHHPSSSASTASVYSSHYGHSSQSHGHHSRHNSISHSSQSDYLNGPPTPVSNHSSHSVNGNNVGNGGPSNPLYAAAQAQAETSRRMYLNGAATAAAVAASSSASGTSSRDGSHSRQASMSGDAFQMNGSGSAFYQPSSNGGTGTSSVPVGSAASSLGLHYPSALSTGGLYNNFTGVSNNGVTTMSPTTYTSPATPFSVSSASSSASNSHSHHHSYSRSTDYYNTAYLSDNSTGAPPFQAPQLYNPSQPSAAANSAFATSTYPSCLAPSHRGSMSIASAPSVRSASMSISSANGRMDEVSISSENRRSGSRNSEGGSGSGGSTLVSSSEAVTPSLTSASSRRSSAGVMTLPSSGRPDPGLLTGKMLNIKSEQRDVSGDVAGYGYQGMMDMNFGMDSSNLGLGFQDDLNMPVDMMVTGTLSPGELATGAIDDSNGASIDGTWSNAANYIGYSATPSPSHTHAQGPSTTSSSVSQSYFSNPTTATGGYNIPPPPARQKSQIAQATTTSTTNSSSAASSLYPSYTDQTQYQFSGQFDGLEADSLYYGRVNYGYLEQQ